MKPQPLDSATRPAARPSAAQLAWAETELALFVHISPATWQEVEQDNCSTPLAAIDSAQLDVEQWADAAESFGAKRIIFTCKHSGGFCWWQTETSPYGVRAIPWRGGTGDVMADLAACCARRGLGLGVYLSPQDRFLGAGIGGRTYDPARQAAYETTFRAQLEELLTRYGAVEEIWFDGSLAFGVRDLCDRLAPGVLRMQGDEASIRWVGNELGFAPAACWNSVGAVDAATGVSTAWHGNPDGERWLPCEVDVPMRGSEWFWNTTNEDKIHSLHHLLRIYYASVGRGCSLLINSNPDRRGLIPDADLRRYREFGDELRRRFATPIAAADGWELLLNRPTEADTAVVMEDLRDGEAVRAWVLEGLAGGVWRQLASGTALGRKRIIPFPAQTLAGVRLRCTTAVGTPLPRRIALHRVGGEPIDIPDRPALNHNVTVEGEATATNGEAAIDIDLTAACSEVRQYIIAAVATGPGCAEPAFVYDWMESKAYLDRIPERMRVAWIERRLAIDGVATELLTAGGTPDRAVLSLTGLVGRITLRGRVRLPPGATGARVYLLRC